jgi:hypothetical protein
LLLNRRSPVSPFFIRHLLASGPLLAGFYFLFAIARRSLAGSSYAHCFARSQLSEIYKSRAKKSILL